MILPRALYNDSPPERRSRIANNPTLLYSWWCTIFSLVIITIRLAGRYVRNERLFREDKLMAWSIIPLLARMGFVHVVLIWGTNNVDTSTMTDPTVIHHREIGAKLVLAARVSYALFIWMAKFTVSEFLKRMTERFWKKGYEIGLRGIRIFLVVTFIAVFIATLAECQPFSHYWQVIPDPGPKCRQGYAHLLTMGTTDIITDILIVIFPIPIILRSTMRLKRKISLLLLFSMSFMLIGITGARIPLVIERRGLQQFRTVFASSEILAATFVSNAIVLGSFLRDRGVKKAKYRGGSTSDSMDRRSSTRRHTLQQWGSDEDLARSLGYRTKPELAEQQSSAPRRAPVADLDLLASHGPAVPFPDANWQFPKRESRMSQSSGESELKSRINEDPLPSPRGGRRVSFYDVGGLLESGPHSNVAPSPTDSVNAHDFAAPYPRRGSRASSSLIPNGRTYPLSPRRSSRISQQSQDYEMASRPTQHLHDAGGLLSGSNEAAVDESLSSSSTTPASLSQPTIHSLQPLRPHQPQITTIIDTPSLQDAGGLISSSQSKPSA
ncbi:hypothetical protein K505DRAFT_355533 [Melanomma pulvis-pyrius CBS 109.77]|uniref:Rhodopsin domain-containing protein n=1 Tax=Melanomma pulvis-pyrius CBS 109.77 TaxID=1314802 RepID=A0A6A6XW10_9PLEO|nr:hypothetical protein K505DRAFT_355533 [Melanomma pulvis-pyrius CBS 109.77]